MPDNKSVLGGSSIWSVLKQPKPRTILPPTGPGTGPYADGTKVDKLPVGRGGRLVPPVGTPDDVGYGSAGDAIETLSVEDSYPEHSNPIDIARLRFPSVASEGPPHPTLPRLNTLYGTQRTNEDWKFNVDVAISGTITPSTSGAVNAAVNLPANQGLNTNRVMQFPAGVQLFLALRQFGFAASALTMTGSLYVFFVDAAGGQTLPLSMLTGTQYNQDQANINAMLTTPITDPGNTALGNLWVSMTNGGTPVACSWYVSFSYVYLLPDPSFNGYANDTIPWLQENYALQVQGPAYRNRRR